MLIIDGLSTRNEATQGCHPILLSVFAALHIRTVIYSDASEEVFICSAAARGFGGQVAFSSLDKSNIPDILAKI